MCRQDAESCIEFSIELCIRSRFALPSFSPGDRGPKWRRCVLGKRFRNWQFCFILNLRPNHHPGSFFRGHHTRFAAPSERWQAPCFSGAAQASRVRVLRIFLRVPSPLPPSPSSVCAIAVPYQLPSRLNSPLFSVPGRPLASFSFHRCWSSAMAPRCILSCPIGCWLVRRSVWVRDHELFDRCHPRSCRPPPARASPLSLPPLPTSISLSSSLDALFGVPLPR